MTTTAAAKDLSAAKNYKRYALALGQTPTVEKFLKLSDVQLETINEIVKRWDMKAEVSSNDK